MAGFAHFTGCDGSGQKRIDRERLAAWARERFRRRMSTSRISRSKQRDEIRAVLVEHSRDLAAAGRRGRRRGASAAWTSCSATTTAISATVWRQAAMASWRRSPIGCGGRSTTSDRPTSLRSLNRDELEQELDDGGRRSLSPRNAPHGADAGAADSGHGLERPPAGDGPFAVQRSACAAMPRSIPRSSTSAKGCGLFDACGPASASA